MFQYSRLCKTFWLSLQENPQAVITVVGNKCDRENARVVGSERGQSFADEHGYLFIETSASDNVNVNEVSIISL